jgi:hypothetical protein
VNPRDSLTLFVGHQKDLVRLPVDPFKAFRDLLAGGGIPELGDEVCHAIGISGHHPTDPHHPPSGPGFRIGAIE